MEDAHALPPQVNDALLRGAIVLTANQRAARALHRAYDLRQRSRGITAWEPPVILAWDSWLESLWHRLLLEGRASDLLLNTTQEHTVWRSVIAANSAASLRPVDALAELAASAWLLLHNYRGRDRLHAYTGNSDSRSFASWAADFERRCTRSRYLTRAQLPESLTTAVGAGHLTFPLEFLLVGFDFKTPAQTDLLDAIGKAGTHIDELHLELTQPVEAAHPQRTLASAPNDYAELTMCARSLRARLVEQPTSQIAVIVPALESSRSEIDRVFRHILAPELNHVTAPAASSGPYEFSLGIPLTHTPLVATALDLLRWASGPLPLDRISPLLLSHHFAGNHPEAPAEYLARAEFDAFELRRQHLLRPELTIGALYTLASGSRRAAALPVLRTHLRDLQSFLRSKDLAGQRSHADWSAVIHEILEAAGWNARSGDDSIEFQTRRKWESALDELATLDFEGVRVSFAAAQSALERIAAQTLFAPESRHAPIQIMGPLESAGSTFDAVWFLGAGDLGWPVTPTPNPLLPWHLQRDLAMPGVDPALDTANARRITERISVSAPTIVFSYAQESSDARQRPSPVLACLALEPYNTLEIPAEAAPPIVAVERISEPSLIPPPAGRVLYGGASILQSQAACGFRAFAEHRLFSSALESPTLGLDASERGSLIHAVLERFWAQVQSQAQLKRMPLPERDGLLADCIEAALARYTPRLAQDWPLAYLDAEARRLNRLLGQWLDYEASQRPPFNVKSLEETLHYVPIGPIQIDIRVDRVDLTGEDPSAANAGQPRGEIILDYKTGFAKPADWLGERPDAPQLPLYAVVSRTPNLAAVAFANVRPGKYMELTGYEAHARTLPVPARLKAESLDAQVSVWRDVLESLAREFHSGEARVWPKRYPQTCAWCKQRLLCRLDPSTLDPETLDDEPEFVSETELSGPFAPGMEADFA